MLGVRSRLEANVTLADTIMIGADRYETDAERERNRSLGVPNVGVGEGTRVSVGTACSVWKAAAVIVRMNSAVWEAETSVSRALMVA